MKNSKIALIGSGYWGKNLARNFSELGALYGICDNNVSSAKSVAVQYDVPEGNVPSMHT